MKRPQPHICRRAPPLSPSLYLALGLAACAEPRAGDPTPERSAASGTARREGTGVVELSLSGFASDSGQALVSLFVAPDGFPEDHERALRTAELPIQGGRASVVFEGLPAGAFAVSVLEDEDRDFAIDKNSLGIPTERWGVSNDARALLGPPSFEEARLELLPGERLVVRITVH